MSLHEFEENEFSQWGEDGIISEIFRRIGPASRWCCEFGASDGIHISNCRALILRGWSAVLIEADKTKFAELEQAYRDWPTVRCLNATVAAPRPLAALLTGVPRLDFLSIDIDGLDYDILDELDIEPPRVICIEANAAHDPQAVSLLPRELAERNVGQPLAEIAAAAARRGYRLVAYTGNALFVHRDAGPEDALPSLSTLDAYAEFLARLDQHAREWLYLVNLGLIIPHHRFHNRHLTARTLGIGPVRALKLRRNADRF